MIQKVYEQQSTLQIISWSQMFFDVSLVLSIFRRDQWYSDTPGSGYLKEVWSLFSV